MPVGLLFLGGLAFFAGDHHGLEVVGAVSFGLAADGNGAFDAGRDQTGGGLAASCPLSKQHFLWRSAVPHDFSTNIFQLCLLTPLTPYVEDCFATMFFLFS